jgi:hypothetical protein
VIVNGIPWVLSNGLHVRVSGAERVGGRIHVTDLRSGDLDSNIVFVHGGNWRANRSKINGYQQTARTRAQSKARVRNLRVRDRGGSGLLVDYCWTTGSDWTTGTTGDYWVVLGDYCGGLLGTTGSDRPGTVGKKETGP